MNAARFGEPRADRDRAPLRTLARANPAPDEPLPPVIADRYAPIGLLGRGGMGAVWRVEDRRLDRTAAMKVLRADLLDAPGHARFLEEGRLSARLQHPGVLPVHDLGTLDDGRAWFVMQEVRGRTLEAVSGDAHRAWRLGAPDADEQLRRLVEHLLRVCETMAFAHAQGVLHRDLKPSNVMLGAFGEVLVVDWGLATRSGAPGAGFPVGTPAYMPPEQARGEALGPWSDTWSLGALLYDLLTDRPPRLARTVSGLLSRVAGDAAFPPPGAVPDAPPVDASLEAICLRALATSPAARFPDASAFAADLGAWLHGARRRDEARRLVATADTLLVTAAAEAATAERWSAQAERLAGGLAEGTRPEEKADLWEAEDAASRARSAASDAHAEAMVALRAALSHADLEEAHTRLAEELHGRIRARDDAASPDEIRGLELELRAHDRSGRFAAFLAGTGALTLHVVPEGADVLVRELVERGRRLEPGAVRLAGRAPLLAAPLPRGRYLAEVRAPGFHPARLPFVLGRQEHHVDVRPDDTTPRPLRLLPLGALGPDDVYVPAGWFLAGDTIFDHTLPVGRFWADDFVIRRDPVTVGEWVEWLDALASTGDEAGLEAAVPRLEDTREPYFARGADGRFTGPRPDLQLEGWHLFPRDARAPVTCVTWRQAVAFAAWRAGRDGVPWRLPMEREWQKAARGGDRRRYPWGDHLEPAWCQMRRSDGPVSRFVRVDERPLDVSPYGVRGLAGNVSDWALDPVPYAPEGPIVQVHAGESSRRLYLGGNCGAGFLACSTAQRAFSSANASALRVGLRLCRSLS